MSSILTGPWSYTRASACARALYMEKVIKAPPEPRPERLIGIDRRGLGTVMHEGAEVILKLIIANKPRPNFRDLCHELLRSHLHLSSATGLIGEKLQLFSQTFRCDWNMDEVERDTIIRERVLGTEMRLAVDAHGQPCAFDKCPADGWRGIVDYAESDGETLTIIDHKNRPAMFSKAELLADEQLSGYAHLVSCHFPDQFKAYRIGIHYFEFGYTHVIDIDEDRLESNVFRLQARASAKEVLTKDDIGPEPGYGKCQYCDYIGSCDAGCDYMIGGELAPVDDEQARQTAAKFLVEKERQALRRDALKNFTGEHGEIVLDDKTEVGFHLKTDGVTYEKDKTLRILKKLIDDGKLKGMQLRDFTKLDSELVKKVAKSEAIYEALASARSPKVDTKFDFYRPKKARGVRVVKEGKKTVVHPDDRTTERKTRGRVKSGGKT